MFKFYIRAIKPLERSRQRLVAENYTRSVKFRESMIKTFASNIPKQHSQYFALLPYIHQYFDTPAIMRFNLATVSSLSILAMTAQAAPSRPRNVPVPTDSGFKFGCNTARTASRLSPLATAPRTKLAGSTPLETAAAGVHDNMHGQALRPSTWGCKHIGKNSAEITFNLELGASAEVERAINAATGSQEAVCNYKKSLNGADLAITGDNPIAGYVSGRKFRGMVPEQGTQSACARLCHLI